MPPTKSRIPNQFPRDQGLSAESLQVLDAMLVNINNLLTQGPPPPAQGIGAFGPNIIDPTGPQISSAGSRTSSLITGVQAVTTTNSASFYWDGTNGSAALQIFRDDGSVFGPFITGSPFVVTGLTNGAKYYFYIYFDDVKKQVKFVSIPGTSVGTPPVAFPAQNLFANQQQILRGRIPMGIVATTTGVTINNTPQSVGTGGGGAGGGYAGKNLP